MLPNEMNIIFNEFKHNRKASTNSVNRDYILSGQGNTRTHRRKAGSRSKNSSCIFNPKDDHKRSVKHTSIYLTNLNVADGTLNNTDLLNSRHFKEDPKSTTRNNLETERGGSDCGHNTSKDQPIEGAKQPEIIFSEFRFDSI